MGIGYALILHTTNSRSCQKYDNVKSKIERVVKCQNSQTIKTIFSNISHSDEPFLNELAISFILLRRYTFYRFLCRR